MTETGMQVKKMTVSSSSISQSSAEQKSSPGWYRLYNDSGQHVSVYRQEWDVPKELFELAPGATSDQYESGHEIYILFSEGNEAKPIEWTGSGSDLSFTVSYNVTGYTHGNGVNNVSAFH
ncbi:hypothetical protein AB0H00_08875 [Nocardia sp. NPDC023852]|uniref:hypothetical protein n=1 Tax=Nocardia sp. NPDC023852 TaxID=3154697 RepID=UPI0033FA4039